MGSCQSSGRYCVTFLPALASKPNPEHGAAPQLAKAEEATQVASPPAKQKKCDNHDDRIAEFHCPQLNGAHLCAECNAGVHAVMKNHTPIAVVAKALSAPAVLCPLHHEDLKIVCLEKECKLALMCADCCVDGEHAGHANGMLETVARDKRFVLRDRIETLQAWMQQASWATDKAMDNIKGLWCDCPRPPNYLEDGCWYNLETSYGGACYVKEGHPEVRCDGDLTEIPIDIKPEWRAFRVRHMEGAHRIRLESHFGAGWTIPTPSLPEGVVSGPILEGNEGVLLDLPGIVGTEGTGSALYCRYEACGRIQFMTDHCRLLSAGPDEKTISISGSIAPWEGDASSKTFYFTKYEGPLKEKMKAKAQAQPPQEPSAADVPSYPVPGSLSEARAELHLHIEAEMIALRDRQRLLEREHDMHIISKTTQLETQIATIGLSMARARRAIFQASKALDVGDWELMSKCNSALKGLTDAASQGIRKEPCVDATAPMSLPGTLMPEILRYGSVPQTRFSRPRSHSFFELTKSDTAAELSYPPPRVREAARAAALDAKKQGDNLSCQILAAGDMVLLSAGSPADAGEAAAEVALAGGAEEVEAQRAAGKAAAAVLIAQRQTREKVVRAARLAAEAAGASVSETKSIMEAAAQARSQAEAEHEETGTEAIRVGGRTLRPIYSAVIGVPLAYWSFSDPVIFEVEIEKSLKFDIFVGLVKAANSGVKHLGGQHRYREISTVADSWSYHLLTGMVHTGETRLWSEARVAVGFQHHVIVPWVVGDRVGIRLDFLNQGQIYFMKNGYRLSEEPLLPGFLPSEPLCPFVDLVDHKDRIRILPEDTPMWIRTFTDHNNEKLPIETIEEYEGRTAWPMQQEVAQEAWPTEPEVGQENPQQDAHKEAYEKRRKEMEANGRPDVSNYTAAEMDHYFTTLFELGDRDKNGILDQDELKELLAMSTFGFDVGTVADVMDMYDTNKDGVIDKMEFRDMMAQVVATEKDQARD